jgi:hypothetical protein
MGHNNNSTMLRSLEATTLSTYSSASTSNEQHEPDVHRLAFGTEISSGNVPAFEKHFSSMEGEF